jgi:hypothetical protein
VLVRVDAAASRAGDLFHVTDTAGNPLDRATADRLSTALANRLLGSTTGRRSPEA